MCDLRATAIAAGICYGATITGPTASTYDDGARGVRRQTVLAEDFRMVSAARQRGALRIPNTAFLITLTMQAATSGVRRRGVGAAPNCVLPLGTTPVGFRCRASLGLGSPSFAPLGFFVWARAIYRSKVAPRHPRRRSRPL